MPLQNRVDPFGELIATPARGTLMGNRGGRFHRADRTLASRRWASRQWICCKLDFNGRRRPVWGDSYTELFFLDEVTAFAAGHRPCFECRRRDFLRFAQAWRRAAGLDQPPRAPEMDRVLQAERLDQRTKRLHRRSFNDLPDAAMIVWNGCPHAVRGDTLLRWSAEGYQGTEPRPRGGMVDVLTPPAILNVLAAGYAPLWPPSASLTPDRASRLVAAADR